MRRFAVAALLFLPGCAYFGSDKAVESDWSCRAVGKSTCATIAENDRESTEQRGGRPVGGVVVDTTALWLVGNDAERPYLKSPSVVRVTIAPYVDVHGNYHAESVVYVPVGNEASVRASAAMAASKPPRK